jgi:CRP-like cAMP-binding protein
MNDFSTLFSYFEKINKRELSLNEKEEISGEFKKETFKKKQLIFSSGEENTRHYYIEKGLLRLYIIDQNGKEFNILFARERQWIGDLGTPAATPYYLDALENSTAFSIEEHQFNKITSYYMDLAKNIRRSYVFLQQRLVSIISKTAEGNYEELLEQNPALIQRLPQYHISSYLGVTPVFLSKILAKRAKKKTN